MKPVLKGRCACGAIQFEAENNIEFAFQCHCRKCQRATGSGHSAVFALSVSDIQFSGDITEYEQGSDAGAATHSGFCSTCGSPVTSRSERFPDRIYIHAATLDEPELFQPTFSIFSQDAAPWDIVTPDVKKV